jgi:hypothetical protein
LQNDPKFGDIIKKNAAQSKPWWAPRAVPPSKDWTQDDDIAAANPVKLKELLGSR